MRKVFTFFLIIIVATIIASIYGIFHDQLTYTISEEYYTKFKFVQFGLDNWGMGYNIGTVEKPEIILQKPRLAVSIVGLLSTWWVGLIAGIILGLLGLIRSHRTITIFKSLMIVLLIAIVSGLLGLLYGKIWLSQPPSSWHLPNHLVHVNQFLMVGSMHNFSYLGGLIGLVISGLYLLNRFVEK